MHSHSSPVRRALREATAAVHARMEHTPAFAGIMRGTASLDDYTGLLQALWSFHASAAPTLKLGHRSLEQAGFAHVPDDGLSRLELDLRALAVARPAPPPALTVSSPAVAAGWCWVVEGSALGGQLVDRALGRLFGADRRARTYFTPRPDAGLRWRTLCATIERYGRLPGHTEDLAEGARAAFALLEDRLR